MKLTHRYYQFWLRLANLYHKITLLDINFHTSWLQVVLQQKKYLSFIIIDEIISSIFYTIFPLAIGWIIQYQHTTNLFFLVIIWLATIILDYSATYYNTLLQIQCIGSIQYRAYEFFLTVDPLYHTTKSTGKLWAKIERGARAYEDFLDGVIWEISPTFINVATVVISFMYINIHIGLLAFASLLVIALFNIGMTILTAQAFEPSTIQADDKVKALSVESLTQIQLVRSSFASNQLAQQVKSYTNQTMVKEATAWIAATVLMALTRVIYALSVLLLSMYIIRAIADNTLAPLIGISLIVTYIRGAQEIIKIGRRLLRLVRSITRIQDLFSFIRTFGKQTFPVLECTTQELLKVQESKQQDIIALTLSNLHFAYTTKAKIFEHHNLYLSIDKHKKNKLYGIIGPSGKGKTTLLSILGGQLKPTYGNVELNGIELYTIGDSSRQYLIAQQGQIASTLSGTLRKNLYLGLPYEKQVYTDQELIKVLKNVGIWSLFEKKEQLDTLIGEGGLTLSGGQRQRLNFASLYLRAQYYRPLLILIDEPTSSLDEISEQAITHMINQLAQHALTLVIAHRLKTLQDAAGIFDISLLNGKNMIFYAPIELAHISKYYKKLISGDSSGDFDLNDLDTK